MTETPKYPNIEVELSGQDGNGFMIAARVMKALKRGGIEKAEQTAFFDEALAGDYDHLLQTCMRWVSVS